MHEVVVGEQDDEIVALECDIRAAQLAGDVPALRRLISDNLLFTGPGGEVGSKTDDLRAHESGMVRFLQHEPEDLRIRRVGENLAITALRARLSVGVGGNAVHGTYRYTRVWARENGHDWQVVGGHVSEIPRAEPSSSNRG